MEAIIYRDELARYEILQKLGEGGNGCVYLVRDRFLNRRLALKMIMDAEIHFFDREIEVLKKAEIAFLPVIYDAWLMQDGTGIIVMEYVEGDNLAVYLKKHCKISEQMMKKWAVSITEFLCYLHDGPYPALYRDLKPENIIVRKSGELALIDFGTVVCLDKDCYTDGKRVGTRGFSAPEQWEGRAIDQRSDIYSFGKVCEVLWQHCIYQSEELERIIRKCTQPLPEDRYRTVQSLISDLLTYEKREKNRLLAERAGYVMRLLILSVVIWFIWT
ncbi:MAG: serine/threonine protein kinase [Lachnospiraceae bacterium]|nr:serine/threonine protein kinase [Lachnospiraceae bacterium]